jgi:predicted anti-sigma-YlaC factor YlaD
MTCQELVEIVTDYLEGEMPERERSRFEEHLQICPGCVYYVEQMRETIRLVGRAAVVEPEALPGMDRLLDAFRDWKRGSPAESV